MGVMTRITTVTKKASPHPIATSLIRVLSTSIRLEYSGDALRSSEVTRSISAMTASHKLMSERVNGKSI
jgi:hypothetical protein